MEFNSSYTPYELAKQYDTTSQEDKRTHYPHLLAPPSLRTSNLPNTRPQRYLNPALWDAVTLGNKTAESQLQAYMWQTESTCNPIRTFTPDSVTTYDYDYDNRLTTVTLPTNNDTVEYTYDATGRRLTKEYTYHNGANTDVTTYKYHYIGSQITEIEINAIRNPGESQTTLRDEEIKIHLGANSQPISYEWVKHISGNTTSATYYYHYDIHGNVLKVTDSSENTKITYTYDVLGKILTESNPDSVLNFFTFRGASQTIWESEIGMYYCGGYYRPDTGTALQGTGAPVLTNPASGAMLNAVAQATSANAQLAMQAMISASTAGSSSGGQPGGFSPPSGPSDGMSKAGRQRTSPDPTPTQPNTSCILSENPSLGGGGLNSAPSSPVMVEVDENGNISMIGDFGSRTQPILVDLIDGKTGKKIGSVLMETGLECKDTQGDISDYWTKSASSCITIDPVEPAAEEVEQTATGGEGAAGGVENKVCDDDGLIIDPGEEPENAPIGSYKYWAKKFLEHGELNNRNSRWTGWKESVGLRSDPKHDPRYSPFLERIGPTDDPSNLIYRESILKELLGWSVLFETSFYSRGYVGAKKYEDVIFSINDLALKYLNYLDREYVIYKYNPETGMDEVVFKAAWIKPGMSLDTILSLPGFPIEDMKNWIISELYRLGIIKFPASFDPVVDSPVDNPINLKDRIYPVPKVKIGNNSSW